VIQRVLNTGLESSDKPGCGVTKSRLLTGGGHSEEAHWWWIRRRM